MATTTIPWGDGSGDNIYLTYSSASGDQTVEVSSDANAGYLDRAKDITFSSGSGGSAIVRTLSVIQPAGSDLIVPVYSGVFPEYNNVARGFPQGGISQDYTQLEYVYNSSSTYLDTGIKPTVDDIILEVRCRPSSGSWYIFQSRQSSSSSVFGITGSSSGRKISIGINGTNIESGAARDVTHIYLVRATFINGVATVYVKDESTGAEYSQTGTYTFAQFPNNLCLWGNIGGNMVNANNYIYHAKAIIDGVCVMDYRPVSLNGANGFYDMVTGTMKTATAGTINAGPSL